MRVCVIINLSRDIFCWAMPHWAPRKRESHGTTQLKPNPFTILFNK